jgi:hypothetical protein
MKVVRRIPRTGPGFLPVLFFLSLALLVGCAESQHRVQADPAAISAAEKKADLAERFGIELVALRLTSAETMLDFRYRVVDSQKAAALLHKGAKPYLLDPATGARLMVPSPAYIGPLRQTAVAPEVGKTYFIFFGNAGRLLKQGDRVTLVLGDARFEGIEIE